MVLEDIKNWCLDWFWPRCCLGCHLEGGWLCQRCYLKYLNRVEDSICPGCGSREKGFYLCANCRDKWFLDGLIVCVQKNQLVKRLMYYYKYFGIYDLAGLWANIYAEKVDIGRYNWLSAVPLSQNKYNRRGYNQSELIARQLAKKTGLKFFPALKRVKSRRSQVGLKRLERLKNVKGDFLVKEKFDGERVLLVDDVCTTMATINECGRVLKKAGVSEVVGIVLARGL